MTRRAAGLTILAAASLLGSFAGAAAERRDRRPMRYASPGKIVAAEVAFSQLAQRKGQWTAFRATASDEAVMFVPQPVIARDWLKRQKNPVRSVAWQPHQVWLSCDGSLAATYGAWQGVGGSNGYFTTVWQRQKDGEYKWVMDQGDDLATPLTAPEMIGAGVGSCDRAARSPSDQSQLASGTRSGWSDDRTLRWTVTVAPDCSRVLAFSLYRGGGKPMEPVLEKRVAAPAPAFSTAPSAPRPAACPAA